MGNLHWRFYFFVVVYGFFGRLGITDGIGING